MKTLLALTLLVLGLDQTLQAEEFFGAYTATTEDGVTYTIVFSKNSENENTLMEVLQEKPYIRQTAPIYELNPQGRINNGFEYGNLILANKGSRNNHFVSYREEISKKINITLIDDNGEEITFYKESDFPPPICRGMSLAWQDKYGIWFCRPINH
jgi:hypothetical protein